MTQSPNTCPNCGGTLPETGELAGTCPQCLLSQSPKREAPELGAVQAMFPQLDIVELLGRGGMGVVYRARQPHLERDVAVKLLAPEIAADPDFASRFLREARALARLNHPNIVGVHDSGERDGTYYLIMEFVEGVSLREVIQQRSMSSAEALAVVPQICAGLQFAHECGVVHRDIKPDNILIDGAGQVKIADFGLAKLVGTEPDNLTRDNQVMGTPHYMAPEQVNQPLEVDHRADLYSLGVVFYEMLTHELPVGRFAMPSERASVDVRIDSVVAKALEQRPRDRYQMASELQTDVEQVSGSSSNVSAGIEESRTRFEWVETITADGALGLGFAGVALAGGWFALLFVQKELFRIPWIALGYPLCFLAVVVVRGRQFDQDKDSRIGMQGLGLLAMGFAAMLVMSQGWGKEMVLQGLAAVLLVAAHLLLDRWVWGGRIQLLAGVAPLFVASVVVHCSARHYVNVGGEGLAYASGMGALISASSITWSLPEFSRSRVSPLVIKGLVRGLCFSVLAAVIYYRGVFG